MQLAHLVAVNRRLTLEIAANIGDADNINLVAVGIGIQMRLAGKDIQQRQPTGDKPRLLQQLAPRGILNDLTDLNAATVPRPQPIVAAALQQHLTSTHRQYRRADKHQSLVPDFGAHSLDIPVHTLTPIQVSIPKTTPFVNEFDKLSARAYNRAAHTAPKEEFSVICVDKLTKSYGASRGIADVSFTIECGEIVGFLGPNGAGKTTTMNLLTGYLSPDSGSVSIADIDMLTDPQAAKRRIGYLPEHPPLYTEMTVREYLFFAARLKGITGQAAKRTITHSAELAGVHDVLTRVIGNLSKGYRQRVGLAQALLGDPDLLILDEPTVGLDPLQIKEVRATIRELGKQRTVILSTHILPEVSAVCQRVLVLNAGKIVADGRPDELATGGSRLIVRLPGPTKTALSLLKNLDGVSACALLDQQEPHTNDYAVTADAGVDLRKPLFDALAKANLPILKLTAENSTLEDVFVRLIGGEEGGQAL